MVDRLGFLAWACALRAGFGISRGIDMCGRYVIKTSTPELAAIFGIAPPPQESGPFVSYNVAPTQDVPVCRVDADGARELVPMHWGLIPHWAKDRKTSARMINARAETVADKPAYRAAVRRRRCLVPASGFYEWVKVGGRKQPYFIGLDQPHPFAFAGLWETWRAADGEPLRSCSIITTEADARIREIHPRMPVILPPEQYDTWLDPAGTLESVLGVLKAYPQNVLISYPVSTYVNSPRNNDERCAQRLAETGRPET